MPKVGIVMGSDSDLKVMSKAAATLEKFGIDYEMTIISAAFAQSKKTSGIRCAEIIVIS